MSKGWQAWDETAKARLRLRAAEACTKAGLPTPAAERYATPGQLALELDRKVVQRAHMEVIDDAFAKVDSGEVDRVLLLTPPQVGKTSRMVWGLFWWMMRHPNDPLILASYAAALASTRGRMARTLVETYGAQFGLVRDRSQWARNDWQTTSGAALRTGGMDSGLTGNPAAAVFIDDPHKDRAEADSPTMREAVWNTYSSSVLSRLRPGGPLFIIQTRWHADDLGGRVLKEEGDLAEGGRWLVLHMEAIATGKVRDPLGRQPGEPLTHPWIPPQDTVEALRHWQEKKATSTIRDWFALYQGDPQPAEGALLNEDQVKAHSTSDLPEPARVGVGVDPSGGGRDEAGIIGGFLGVDGKLYWTEDRSAAMSSDEWSRETCLLAHELGAEVIFAEANYGRDLVHLAIRTAWDALQREEQIPKGALCPRIKLVNSKRGKLLRAEPIAQQVIEDRARFGGPLKEFKNEWMTWQPPAPGRTSWSPGRLDAGVHLAYGLLKVPGASAVVSTVADKPKTPTGASRMAKRTIDRRRAS